MPSEATVLMKPAFLARPLSEQGLGDGVMGGLARAVTNKPHLEAPLAPPLASTGDVPDVTDENKEACAVSPSPPPCFMLRLDPVAQIVVLVS